MPQHIAIVVKFYSGSFEEGFNCQAEILEDGNVIRRYPELGATYNSSNFLRTPPAPEMMALYQEWEHQYNSLERVRGHRRGVTIPTEVIEEEQFKSVRLRAKESADKLAQYFTQTWLENLSSFENLRNWIKGQKTTQSDQSIPVLFEFNTDSSEYSYILRRLPWHLWKLTSLDFPRKSEIGISVTASSPLTMPLSSPVKILSIMGGHGGELNLSQDESIIQTLADRGASIKPLNQPSVGELQSVLESEAFDILFFSGHSYSDPEIRDGHLVLKVNQDANGHVPVQTCSLETLRPSLMSAKENGLKLAIFNSCDGLGLADSLAGLQIPFSVVFRESVPDEVAIEFLRTFLDKFSNGELLYPSLRAARNKLRNLDSDYPAASWLPIICQSQSQRELVWPATVEDVSDNLIKTDEDSGKKWRNKLILASALAVGLLASYGMYKVIIDRQPQDPVAEAGLSLKLPNISLGEESLIAVTSWPLGNAAYDGCRDNISLKNDAVTYFRNNQWQTAIRAFESYREVCKLDPEALIYLNNARAAQSNPDNAIRLGVTVPLAGSTFGPGAEILRGVAQAQDKINNRGGVGGRLIQVQIVNDRSQNSITSNLSQQSAEAIVQDPAVLAVIGSYTSTATLESANIYGDALVSISPTSTAVRGSNFNLPNNTFRTAPTDAEAARDLAQEILDSGYQSVGIIYGSASDYSMSLKTEITASVEGSVTVVSPESCDLDLGAFSPSQCVSALSDVDALIVVPSMEVNDDVQRIVSQNASRANLPLLGGDSIFGSSTLDEVGASVNGMRVAIPWHPEVDGSGRANAFLREASETWGTTSINWRTALAYDAVQALAGAIGRLPSDQITRESIKGQLLGGRFNGFLGEDTVEFETSGDRILDPSLNLGVIVQVQCSDPTDNASCRFGQPQPE